MNLLLQSEKLLNLHLVQFLTIHFALAAVQSIFGNGTFNDFHVFLFFTSVW